MEGNIYNTLDTDPVKVSDSSDNQVPTIEESTWENNDTIGVTIEGASDMVEPEKVDAEENKNETPIDRSLVQPEMLTGTTLKNLNFR